MHVHCMCMYCCSSCDLIGQLPLNLHGDDSQVKDHNQLNNTISGLLLLQKSNLLLPALREAVCDHAVAIATQHSMHALVN